MTKTKAFTFIELMLVIAIMGVLAALLTGNFMTSLKKGRDASRKADLALVQRGLEMYYEDNHVYPPSPLPFGGKLCHPKGCDTKIYIQKVPSDPVIGWATYEYKVSASGDAYKLFACLENNQQVLTYTTLKDAPVNTCGIQCYLQDGTTDTTNGCIWALSSSNMGLDQEL